ncbi:uncharacterized protein LOC110569394 isoform X10 [Aotus nancymaae]|uniref:uncharacterized protein LOC110569394 isoform X10 n=1 Tax=Aotus nancymaae TaxID=37293 RepID=UPI0030FE413E
MNLLQAGWHQQSSDGHTSLSRGPLGCEENGCHHVAQVKLKLLASSSPAFLASQSAGITGWRELQFCIPRAMMSLWPFSLGFGSELGLDTHTGTLSYLLWLFPTWWKKRQILMRFFKVSYTSMVCSLETKFSWSSLTHSCLLMS